MVLGTVGDKMGNRLFQSQQQGDSIVVNSCGVRVF